MMMHPLSALTPWFSLPVNIAKAFTANSSLPLHELDKAKVQTPRAHVRPFPDACGVVSFSAWRLAHAIKKADCLRWPSAPHPTADMLEIIAGIKPAASHYAAVRIEPHLGSLKKLDAIAQTPAGPVSVRYRRAGAQLRATIDIPKNLSGVFVWNDREQALKPGRNTLTFP